MTDTIWNLAVTPEEGSARARSHVRKVMRGRRNRPLFFIDIAVPRDLDPAINELDNVYLYDIDDLQDVVKLNQEERRREAVKAERIIADSLDRKSVV